MAAAFVPTALNLAATTTERADGIRQRLRTSMKAITEDLPTQSILQVRLGDGVEVTQTRSRRDVELCDSTHQWPSRVMFDG